MDRAKITDILNRIIDIEGEVYDLTHTDSAIREQLSMSLSHLEEAERPLKEALSLDADGQRK